MLKRIILTIEIKRYYSISWGFAWRITKNMTGTLAEYRGYDYDDN